MSTKTALCPNGVSCKSPDECLAANACKAPHVTENCWGGISGEHACCDDAVCTVARDKDGWYLDEDYRPGPYIKFCPFCGEKLAVPIDGSTTTKEIK